MHKVDGQEMNVKKLCKKENIIYHGEDRSEFTTSIYHCFLFLDPHLVMSDGLAVWP